MSGSVVRIIDLKEEEEGKSQLNTLINTSCHVYQFVTLFNKQGHDGAIHIFGGNLQGCPEQGGVRVWVRAVLERESLEHSTPCQNVAKPLSLPSIIVHTEDAR